MYNARGMLESCVEVVSVLPSILQDFQMWFACRSDAHLFCWSLLVRDTLG